jgi:hypothetical protein
MKSRPKQARLFKYSILTRLFHLLLIVVNY